MMLSMATDYDVGVHEFRTYADFMNGVGNPEQYLQRIAEAGFGYVHWCHHWRSDFFYQEPELVHIGHLLKTYDLQILDIHGSEGIEKFWYSPQEYARLAGVELVKNRIDFAARFGADAVVMHAYPLPADPVESELLWSQLRKTLDALVPYCRHLGVKLAIENLIDFPAVRFKKLTPAQVGDNRDLLGRIFAAYPPDVVGLCWDSGHGNLGYDRLEVLEKYADRLIVTHLHDNDGKSDQHRTLFTGTVDWSRTARLIAASPYNKPLTLEVCIDDRFDSQEAFLQESKRTGEELAGIISSDPSFLSG
ncbi:MAG: sugar phosphate isomerase/epimerase family protein [Ardenticatenaceae bacterium]